MLITFRVMGKKQQIWLWHPNFGYLKHLFPGLFSDLVISDFQCDTCILAKSHRVSYPLHMNRSNMPFAVVHSVVWGPSPISVGSRVR